jgi:hypothetical protein
MFTPESFKQWVERTCKEQGVPVKVGDVEAVSSVVALLGSGARDTEGVAHRVKDARPA